MKSYSELITPFFIDDEFFAGHDDLIDWVSENFASEADALDAELVAQGCTLEPIIQLSHDNISDYVADYLAEERYSEDNVEREVKSIKEACKLIDFTKANEAMPKIWYANSERYRIVYDDFKEAFKK